MVRSAVFAGLLAAGAWPAAAAASPCAERLLPAAPPSASRRSIDARDLVGLRDFGRIDSALSGEMPFSISPDGLKAALVLRRADHGSDSYCFGLVLIMLDGSAPARLLDVGGEFIFSLNDNRGVAAIPNGTPKPVTPLWSGDGRWLVYLRRDQGRTQVWRVGLDGQPATMLTHLASDALDLAWAADRRTLLVTSRPSLDAGEASIAAEGRRGYRFDQRFWALSEDRPKPALPLPYQTSVVDVSTGSVHAVEPHEMARLTAPDPEKPAGAQAYARSGGSRAWIAPADPDRPFGTDRLHVEVDGRSLACPEAICSERVALLWWARPDELLFMRAGSPGNGGRVGLYRWRIRREAGPSLLFETTDAYAGCELTGTVLICARETATRPRALVRLDPLRGRSVTLFDPNPEFAGLRLGSVRRLVWSDAEGITTYGDLVMPPTHRAGERHPLVIVQYQSRGFLRGGTGDEFPIQLLVAHGFAVLSFQRPSLLKAALTARDGVAVQHINIENLAERRMIFAALQAGLDAAIADGKVDPERIGITGLSDGAVTLQFALNNSNRFKAAALGSCCDEPSGMFVVSPGYTDALIDYGYPPPEEGSSAFWKPLSIARNADRLRTPILMQLADREYRLALETIAALRRSRSPAELFVFPDEYHLKWHPAHRLAVYERNVAWFDFWLQDRVSRDPLLQPEMAQWHALREQRASSDPQSRPANPASGGALRYGGSFADGIKTGERKPSGVLLRRSELAGLASRGRKL